MAQTIHRSDHTPPSGARASMGSHLLDPSQARRDLHRQGCGKSQRSRSGQALTPATLMASRKTCSPCRIYIPRITSFEKEPPALERPKSREERYAHKLMGHPACTGPLNGPWRETMRGQSRAGNETPAADCSDAGANYFLLRNFDAVSETCGVIGPLSRAARLTMGTTSPNRPTTNSVTGPVSMIGPDVRISSLVTTFWPFRK